MTWFKYLITIIIFFIFSLLQASFFPYFAIFGAVPNLLFAAFFILIFFEPKNTYLQGFFTAVLAGLFSDMFLSSYFGISIAAFLTIYFLYIAIAHFLINEQNTRLIFYFVGIFSVLFVAYNGFMYAFSSFFNIEFTLGLVSLISLAYSLVFAVLGFYIAKKLFSRNIDNQLKLL